MVVAYFRCIALTATARFAAEGNDQQALTGPRLSSQRQEHLDSAEDKTMIGVNCRNQILYSQL